MRRFVYSPDVQAYIATQERGIIDVSADVVSGSVNRVLDGASTAELVLNSPNRKYLRVFRPMDRIAIFLTRIKPVLVFTGYLDRTPLDQLYPGPVTINASCPIKRLLYTYWDPTLAYTERWFAQHGWTWDIGTGQIYSNEGKSMWNLDLNGTIGQMMRQVLHDVGNWPIGQGTETRNTVHILGLPQAFLTKTQDLISKEITADAEQRDNILKFLKALLTVDGIYSDPFNPDDPNADAANFTSTQVDDTPLPASLAKSYHASIYGPAYALSGMAGAIKKEAAKDGISLTTDQAQSGSIIYSTMLNSGFTENSAAAWVSASFAESHLNKGIINSSSSAGGLFQLLSGNFYGKTGVLAQVAKEDNPNYSGDPQKIGSGLGDNGAAASNPLFNAKAILHNANVPNATQAINGASDPVKAIVDIFLRPGSPGDSASQGDYDRGHSILPAIQRATKSLTTTSGAMSESEKGSIGEVKVGSKSFFTDRQLPKSTTTVQVGYTFRIKDNPYGNDNMIFRAATYDPSLDDQEIAIYVPGAKGKSSPQAALWSNKTVTVETSVNKANRFPSSSTNTSSTGPTGPNANTVATKVIQIALKEVGTTEQGYNTGPQVSKYQAATNPKLGPGQPWCVAFVQWCFQQAGRPLKESGLTPGTSVLQSAYANTNDPQPGDIITWSDAHTGLVVKRDGDTVYTVEGNAGNNSNAVVENHFSLANPLIVDGSRPIYNRVPGIGLAAPDANIPSTDLSTVYGGTGVSLNQTTIAQIAASTSYGLGIVFPLVSDAIESANFRGERALQNDVPLIDWVKFMCTASGRRFQTLPNGDFMAFYPDYFNWSQQAPYWVISDIETQDLTIDVSDEKLATHVFTTADSFSPNGQIDLDDKLASTVASIESISTFKALVGVSDDFGSTKFMQRYGARPMTEDVPEIKNSFMQFMYGWMKFLQQWAEMFFAQPTFTFMPELYPGGLIEFKSKDLVMFINSVTHSFDRTSGFTTTAELISPSTRSKKSTWDFPMVLTNGYQPVTTYNGPH